MSPSESRVYSHSGALGPALFAVPIVALIAAVALGTAYAYIDVYSPIAGYVSLLFVAGFAFGLGWIVSTVGFLARCRNTGFLFVVGLVAGLVGLYVSWAAFIYAVLKRYAGGLEFSLVDLFLSPAAIWDLARMINETGWYSIRDATPSGWVLWAFWGVEALAIVGGTAYFSMMAIKEEVFCERCDQWTSRFTGKIRLAWPGTEDQLKPLAPDNLAPLEALASTAPDTNPHLRVDTWECRTCKGNPAVQVKSQATVLDKKGKPEEQVGDITPIWSIPAEALTRLIDASNRPVVESGAPPAE